MRLRWKIYHWYREPCSSWGSSGWLPIVFSIVAIYYLL